MLPSLFSVWKLLLQLAFLVCHAMTLRDSFSNMHTYKHVLHSLSTDICHLPPSLPPFAVPPRRLIDSLAVSRIENRMQQLAGQCWCYPALLLITKHQAAKWAPLTDSAGKAHWQAQDLTRCREVLHRRYMGIYRIKMSSILRWALKARWALLLANVFENHSLQQRK